MRTKSSEFFFEANQRDSFLISWRRSNLMHTHEGKKKRGKETIPKGACNYSQGCIAEVEREGP